MKVKAAKTPRTIERNCHAIARFLASDLAAEADRFVEKNGYLGCVIEDPDDFYTAVDRIRERLQPEAKAEKDAVNRKHFTADLGAIVGEPMKAINAIENAEMGLRAASMDAAYLFGLAVGQRVGRRS